MKGGISIKLKKILILIIFACLFSLGNMSVKAASELKTVILGGDSIGLQMSAKVSVIGFYDVETKDGKKISPWKDSDIKEGDIISSIDGNPIASTSDIVNAITNKEKVDLKLTRDNQYVNTKINVITNKHGKNSIGLYVKDKILGVGTLTFVDPVTKSYGALGHSVVNGNNGGDLLLSSIKSIRKAAPGVPGEKYAILSNNLIGTISKNSDIGIFGKMTKEMNGTNIKVQNANAVKLGKAQILTVVDGNEKEYFDVEIIELKSQTHSNSKGIKVKITDQKLIDVTGGIIQGMSGSPIIQNGYLVGALSHVVVSTPSIGYGVYAQWMLEESN